MPSILAAMQSADMKNAAAATMVRMLTCLLPLTKRLIVCAGLILALGTASAPAQQPNAPDAQKIDIYALFHHGKVKQAIQKLQAAIDAAASPIDKLMLRRSLLDMCATGDDWNCVARTIQDMLPTMASDPKLAPLYPEIVLYETKLMRRSGNDQYLLDLLKRGGAFAIANPASHPAQLAELQLVLHDFHFVNNDLKAAEQSFNSAILSLLLVDPSHTYEIAKIVIGLIGTLLDGRDIVSAMHLAVLCDEFIHGWLPRDNALFARYQMYRGQLFSFTHLHSMTLSNLQEASRLFERLDIAEDAKLHQMAVANSLSSAALVMDGKIHEAKALHAQHPLQRFKDSILHRGAFHSYGEFFFAVSDVLVHGLVDGAPIHWRPLFAQPPNWKLTELERVNLDSYRNFALGLLALGSNADEGSRLLIKAATQRIDNFESVLSTSFEGFQLPSLVDKIVIMFGLPGAAKRIDDDGVNFMLRAGEIVNRNHRHSLVDIASLLAAQPGHATRRNVHTYANLRSAKREWELDRIRMLLTGAPSGNQGALINEYTEAVEGLVRVKEHLGKDHARAAGLPTLASLRQRLSEGEAFVTYFPIFGSLGKLCVTRHTAKFASTRLDPDIMPQLQLLEFAVTATHPADAVLDAQFPVSAAININRALFGGLDDCLKPGTQVSVALLPEFASVPLAALLQESPPRKGEDFDLAKAAWLVKSLSFSLVISARHYLATTARDHRQSASRRYLGVGDPALAGPGANQLASVSAIRGGLKTRNGIADFKELPETAQELAAVAKFFAAPGADVLTRDRATEQALREKPLVEYDVLHFATHGLLKEELPGLTEAALLLTPGTADDKFDDGVLSASEIARLSLNASLVVLSACNTAKYEMVQASRGVQDLQAAFTIAGTPTLVASLWPIESATARDIAEGFFTEWRSGKRGAAESLAAATRTYLARTDAAHQHPRFWAPFVVVGDGAVRNAESARRPPAAHELQSVDGYAAGGEIVDAIGAGDDLILSMMAQWDGRKMNGILTRRTSRGAELWRIGSRDISTGKIATFGNEVFWLGHTTEDNPVPTVRFVDAKGDVVRTTRFPEFRGYGFQDLVVNAENIFIAAFPRGDNKGPGNEALLLVLGRDGELLKMIPIPIRESSSRFGSSAFIAVSGQRIAVATNAGAPPRLNFDRRTILGLPPTCYENASTTLHEIDSRTFTIVATRTVRNFRASSLLPVSGGLLIGGEALDNCGRDGVASIVRFRALGDAQPVWTDDGPFAGSVRGMAVAGKDVLAAVNRDRPLGIRLRNDKHTTDVGNRRFAERIDSAREASIVGFTADGRKLGARDMSAGLRISVQGVAPTLQGAIIYGSLGGVPAMTRH
jgi:CHAT domain-containing protein